MFGFFLLFLTLAGSAKAGELRVSSTEPLVVSAPAEWQAVKTPRPPNSPPMETYRISAPGDRNAVCLISVLGKDREEFAEPDLLTRILRGDSRPYVSSPSDLPNIEIKKLKIGGGAGHYANFVDPDLVDKPVKKGDYKTATPIILNLGTKYLIKVTILCDEINGADYRDALRIVESIKLMRPEV